MKCSMCGNVIEVGARFCSSCGERLPQPEKGLTRSLGRCPACNLELQKPCRECLECGTLLKVPPKAAARADEFIGRHSTLRRIESWLGADPADEPLLVLTGGPGSGKSALMAWLCGAGPTTLDRQLETARKCVYDSLDAIEF